MKQKAPRLLFTLLLLLLALSLAACSTSTRPGSYANGGAAADGYYSGTGDVSDKEHSSLSSITYAPPSGHLLIKTVNETVETLEYDEFLDALTEAVRAAGGYLSSSSYRDGSYNTSVLRTASLVIRIPAEELDGFCSRVDGIGHVTSFYETVDDITLAYVSIESRIGVLESEESALLGMLSRAETVADMLAVRKQLESVQGELAELRAQQRVYDDQIAYSTVNMTVREVKRVSEDTERMGFGEELWHTFMSSLYGIGDFFRALAVFIGGYSPVILLLAAVVAVIVLLLRHLVRRERTRAAKRRENDQA